MSNTIITISVRKDETLNEVSMLVEGGMAIKQFNSVLQKMTKKINERVFPNE